MSKWLMKQIELSANRPFFLAPYSLQRCELSEVGVAVQQHPFSPVFGYGVLFPLVSL